MNSKDVVGRIRWILPFVIPVTITINFLDRLNLSLALPKITEEFHWTVQQTGEWGGLLISIFFVGYGLANIFLSPLAEKLGPRKSLIAVVFLFSLFTALTAPVASVLMLFVLVRFMLGLGEGVHIPMTSNLVKNWFPVHERSRANGIWSAGIMLSTIILPLTLVPIIEWLGWRGMFYVLGILGALISIPLIWKFVYDTPRKHPTITTREIEYIESGMEQDEQAVEGSIWKQMKPIAQDRKYWFAQIGGILNNFVTYGLLMWFPTYFTQARGVEFTNLKYAVSIPYISGVLGIVVVALISDKTQRRVLIAGLGSFLTAVSAYFACTVPTIPASIALFSAAVFFQMGYTTNEFAIVQRILPKNRVGTGTGIYNGLAILIGGGLGPVITGQVIAYTGSLTYGILTVVIYALLAGTNMLVFSRFLKF